MNNRNPAQVFDEIAQQQIRKDINLSSRILESVRKENRKIMKSRFVIAGVCVIALVVVLLFTVPGVATAMKRLLGYVPNIGIVEDSTPMRILKEPVQYSHGDTTITIQQGVSDTLHTTLVYQAENIPASPAATEIEISQMCHQQPELLLPDGSRLQGQAETGNYWISGFNRRVVYPALPGDVYSVKLVFACLEQTAISPDTQGWEIVLDFVDAPADMAVYPLVEFSTPTPLPTESGTADPTLQEPAADNYQSDVNLVVEQYLQTDENLVLFGTMDSTSGQARIELLDSSAIHLTDSSGKDIPLMEDYSLANPDNKKYSNTSIQWAYVTAGDIAPGPATLTVDSVWIFLNEEVQFTFDPGENPQPDQEWILNQTVLVADREIEIQSVRMNSKGDGLSFNINVPEDVMGMNVMDLEHQLTPGGGGQGSYGFTYQDGFPSGKINVVITSISLNITGPWQTSLDLPAVGISGGSEESTDACLTHATWKAAIANPMPLPNDLDGLLMTANPLAPDYYYHIMTVNLDGSNEQIIAESDGGELSPDSSQMIYNSDTGLQLMNMETKTITPVSGTALNDRSPLWSPDGTKIAFTRGPASGLIGAPGPYSIIVSNPDGSNQVALVSNTDANFAQAWLPDGETLLYTVASPEGASVRKININTGSIEWLFNTNYIHSSIAVSPDGKRVAYEAMAPGDQYAIFVANLDGSNARMVSNTSPIVTTIPRWSPDGNWLIVSVHDETLSETSVLALIQIDTCQVVPLTNIKGYVTTWN